MPQSGGGGANITQGSQIADGVITTAHFAADVQIPTVATIPLSAAQIIGLFATPVELIAAPGAGKVIMLEELLFDFTVGGTQFTGGGGGKIYYSGQTQHLLQNNSAPFAAANITGAANFIIHCNMGAQTTAAGEEENLAVVITNITAAFATGDGTANVHVKYRILTL